MLRVVVFVASITLVSGRGAAADEPATGPQIEIHAMDADGKNVRKIAALPDFPIINSPEISPDGKFVAVDGWRAGQDNTDAHLLIVNIKTGRVHDLGIGCMPSWSADGQWIAYSRYQPNGGVFLRGVDGDAEQLIDRNGWGIQWSPDGFKTAYTRGGNIIVYDINADTRREIFPAKNVPYQTIYWNCKWSPDSTRICFKGRRQNGKEEFAIVSVVGNDPKLRVRCAGEDYNPDIGWHPDGKRVTIPRAPKPGQPGQIYEFDPDGDEAPVPVAGQPTDRHNSGMSWSKDGKTLVFVSFK